MSVEKVEAEIHKSEENKLEVEVEVIHYSWLRVELGTWGRVVYIKVGGGRLHEEY